MTQMREEGIRAIDEGKRTKLFMAEWSCPPGVDYMARPDLWPMANPAIGYTLDPAVLADESEQIDKGAFLRASLNVWVTTVNSWLAPGVFDALEVPNIPAGGVLAIDSSIDEALYSGVRAVELEDGRIGVTVAFVADSLAACWEQVEHEAAGCVSVAMPPNMFDIAPVSLARKKVQVGYGEIQTHTSTVRSLINEGRLVHTGEEMLREHVGRAVGVETRNGYAIVSQRSPGPITMARCMVWAASIIAKPVTRKKPQIAFAGR
jgi:phage terminase large subunit-like protein